jgi:AraC-like DNA-binding protein
MLIVAPLEAKTLLAHGVPFVLMDAEPSHRHFRVLAAACRNSGVEALPEGQARAFSEMAHAFHAGNLTGTDVDRAARESIDKLAAAWPAPPALDPRVQRMQEMMDLHPAISLHEMAVQLGLSDSTASRLFSRDMGIAQRIYSLAIKVRAAAQYLGSGLSLTEIGQDAGFVDSAHFAKVWARCYGAPPSVFFPPNRLAMDNASLPDWKQWVIGRHERRPNS